MIERTGLLTRAAAVAQIVVEDLDNPVPGDSDEAHLTRVLRIRDGKQVALTDGVERWRMAEWRSGALVPVGEVQCEGAREPRITVALAVVKSDKPDLAVQKLTELAVDRIVLLGRTERTVVRWDGTKVESNLRRMRRIAYEASMQCRRVALPEVTFVEDLPALAADLKERGESLTLASPGGGSLTIDTPAVAIGPEGGWAPHELDLAGDLVDLGDTVLRAETAAVVAGASLCAARRARLESSER